MWGTVLVIALMTVIEPVRLGMAMFLISGRRPMHNLLAFCVGGMTTGIGVAVVVLVMLRDFTSMVSQNMTSMAASIVPSSGVRHVQIVFGVLALLIAALIAVGFSVSQGAPMPMGEPSALLRLRTRATFSRLRCRAQGTLKSGSPWVGFVVGLSSAAPPPVEYLAALTIIRASGATVGTQLSAAVAFTVVTLAILEISLVSYLVKPAKTEAVMVQLGDWVRKLRDWQRAHRRRILAVVIAVAGVALVATGMS